MSLRQSAVRLRGYVRQQVYKSPRLYTVTRIIRFALIVGPFRPLLIWCAQRLRHNVTVPVAETSFFSDFDPVQATQILERDGYAPGLMLPAVQADEIVRHFAEMKTKNLNPHEDCDLVDKIFKDPKLVEAAREYLGVEPILLQTRWWRTPAGEQNEHSSRFHFDVCDAKSMAVFFYLTDVRPDGAAHVVIKGTHARKSFAEIRRIYLTENEALQKYGPQIDVIVGLKGTGFLEEQTIYHKVLTGSEDRIIIAFLYSMSRTA